jgi:hypothetical protein
MFVGANKRYEASRAPQRNNLEKELFPSSSPAANGDIRETFKKPKATGAPTAAPSARINLEAPAAPKIVNSTIGRIYGGSDSFASAIDVDDHVGTNSHNIQINQDVWFGEDDFSDDENLDLDFEADPPGEPAGHPPRLGLYRFRHGERAVGRHV